MIYLVHLHLQYVDVILWIILGLYFSSSYWWINCADSQCSQVDCWSWNSFAIPLRWFFGSWFHRNRNCSFKNYLLEWLQTIPLTYEASYWTKGHYCFQVPRLNQFSYWHQRNSQMYSLPLKYDEYETFLFSTIFLSLFQEILFSFS